MVTKRSPSATLRRSRLRKRVWLAVAVVAAIAVTISIVLVVTSGGTKPSGGHPTASPRPLTADEADRLAVMRYRNYQTGLHFRTTTNTGLTLVGDLDFHKHVGYAMATDAGQPSPVQWNTSTLVQWAWPTSAAAGEPPAKLPTTQHRTRALDPSKSDLDALLAILLALGQDRPDNSALIQQDGATYVRADSVGGVPVDVLDGPRTSGQGTASSGALTYWVDASGHLRRADVVLGQSAVPVQIDTDPNAFQSFQVSSFVVS